MFKNLELYITRVLGGLFIILISCQQAKENSWENKFASEVNLKKVDSVSINFLGDIVLQDIDPISETIIFTDNLPHSSEIFLADFQGNIFKSFSKFGDVPDTYGQRLAPIRIIEENRLLIYGSAGFFTYDFTGKLISKVKNRDFELLGSTGGNIKDGMEKVKDGFLLMNQTLPPDKDYSDINLYEKMYVIDLLQPKIGGRKPIIKFPRNSIFRSGKHFFRRAWDPTFTNTDGYLYVVFGLEPVIYIYDAKSPYTLISQIDLNFKEYRGFRGTNEYSPEGNSLFFRFNTGFIENIKKFEDYFLIAYFPGYDTNDLKEYSSKMSINERQQFGLRMKEKYQYRLAIFDKNGALINDFIPSDFLPYSMYLKDGQLWVMEKPDPDVEKDYFKLYRIDFLN